MDLTKPIYFELANFNTIKSICKGFFKILIDCSCERPKMIIERSLIWGELTIAVEGNPD